jgi:predicted Zn-dependent protease
MQLAKGDIAAARASFERALAKKPLMVDALRGLNVIDLQQNKGAAARSRAEKALAAAPEDHALQVLAGRTYLSLDDYAAAERALKQAVASDSHDFEAFGLLATVYVRQNKLTEATAEFEKLVACSPGPLPTSRWSERCCPAEQDRRREERESLSIDSQRRLPQTTSLSSIPTE